MKFEIEKYGAAGRIVKLDDNYFFVAVVNTEEKIISQAHFTSRADAQAALDFVFDVASTNTPCDFTVQDFISAVFLKALDHLGLTFTDYEKEFLDS